MMEELPQDVYAQYLRRLDARAILEHYGARNCREQTKERDGTTEIVHSCLLDRVEPHHANGDQNPSAAMNIDKKKYVCSTMGWGGDLIHFIMKMEGIEELHDALTPAGKFLADAVVSSQSMTDELERAFGDGHIFIPSMGVYDRSIIRPWLGHHHPYWDKRGISPSVCSKFSLGYDPKTQRVVFPHFVLGELVGWQKRSIPGETAQAHPKYKNSPAFPKSSTLYAYDEVPQYCPVLVVESPMSVVKAYSIGLAGVVATFGAKVAQAQINLLKAHKKVVVWFDADSAGDAGERKLLENLYRHTEVLRVRPAPRQDLGDIESLQEFMDYTNLHTEPAFSRLAEYDLRS
jgi:DNA primase